DPSDVLVEQFGARKGELIERLTTQLQTALGAPNVLDATLNVTEWRKLLLPAYIVSYKRFLGAITFQVAVGGVTLRAVGLKQYSLLSPHPAVRTDWGNAFLPLMILARAHPLLAGILTVLSAVR